MRTLVWLGPPADATPLAPALAALGLELVAVPDLPAAVRAASAGDAVALVVGADTGELDQLVSLVTTARPDVQVLVATHLGLPDHVRAALDAGAAGLLDLTAADPTTRLGAALARVIRHHERASRERELLARLHDLNEDFLKAMVVLDKRNAELEDLLQGERDEPGARRVLVVDDEPPLAMLISMVLTDHGYDVVTAGGGEEAMRAFRTQFFHIVVTDKNLPGMDGIAILREVRRLRPDTEVVMITAYGSKESAIAALDLGAAAYLEKPFADIEDVARKIDEVTERQRARQKKREFLQLFKERNREFLEQYRAIRSDLEAWLGGRR